MELIAFWVVLCAIVAVAASNKGRSGVGWFVLAILISPILAGLFVLVVSNKKQEALLAAAIGAGASSVAVPSHFVPSNRVPPEGMPSWERPDPSGPQTAINGGVQLAVRQRIDDWAQVQGSNGWVGWVDARKLQPLTPPPDAAAAAEVEG